MKTPSPQLHDFERLLIVKTSSIGDVIHALPVVSLLKQARPSLSIGWVVRNKSASVLEGNPDVEWLHTISDRSTTKNMSALRNELHRYDYQCALDMQGLFMSGMIAFLSGAPVRIGLDRNREANKLFLTHPIVPGGVGRRTGDRHAIDILLGFARVLGVDPIPDLLPVQSYLARDLDNRVDTWFAGLRGPKIALNVGASSIYKQWPVEHWIELSHFLLKTGCSVVFIGDHNDAQKVKRVCVELVERGVLDRTFPGFVESALKSKSCLDLSGRTSLRELASALTHCDLLVSGDTGPLHLASAAGVPVVALFGSTNPLRTGPYGKGHVVLNMDLPCSPCYRKPTCNGRVDCMRAITPAFVFEAVRSRIPGVAPA